MRSAHSQTGALLWTTVPPGVTQLPSGRNHGEIPSPNSCQRALEGCLGLGCVPGTAPGVPHGYGITEGVSTRLGCTRTPLPDPSQVLLCGTQLWGPSGPPGPTEKRVTHNFPAPFPKGYVPGWTPVDTSVGSLRTTRSWECSSLVVWTQMTLNMSLSASWSPGMALGPRELKEALG